MDRCLDRILVQPQKYQLYQFIAGIYCLSKLEFISSEFGCDIDPSSQNILKLAAHLLQVQEVELVSALLNRTIGVDEKIKYVDSVSRNKQIHFSIEHAIAT